MSTLSPTPRPPRQRLDVAHPLAREVSVQRELVEIFNSLPYMALVVNRFRETVFANRALLTSLGFASLEEALGQRPGALLSCLQLLGKGTECGATDECRYCQASAAIDECLETGRPAVREARMSTRVDNRLAARDLRVTVQPTELAGQRLVMIYLEDISGEKRREHLESIFLHDLLNSIGSLQLVTEVLKDEPSRRYVDDLVRQVGWLADEVQAHRLLSQAESGQLVSDISCVPVRGLIDDVLLGLEPLATRRGVVFIAEIPTAPVYLASDPRLARRVVMNAVKNAVEAVDSGGSVRLGVLEQDHEVVVTVWNAKAMSEPVRLQLFQRSYSTKGSGRGLGTYGMRLLMENYLDGSVRFTSDEATGTTFLLSFPSMRSYLARSS